MKTSDQLPVEVARHAENVKTTGFYQDYVKLSAKYKELQEKGVTQPRESQLRSIADPPIGPMSVSSMMRR